MTTAVLSPLRKQGDVSKDPTAPTAVLLQGSSAPPTVTASHEQGTNTFPTATTTCTQGSGSSLLDTLAHCYTPIVHLGLLLTSIKGRSRALVRRGGRAGGRADARALSLSLANACNPLLQAHPPWAQDKHEPRFPLLFPLVFRLAPTHLGWDTQRQFTRRSRDPPGIESPTVLRTKIPRITRSALFPPVNRLGARRRRRPVSLPRSTTENTLDTGCRVGSLASFSSVFHMRGYKFYI
jgi:hypothetical protein